MKRLWFSAIFMLAALLLCFGEQIYISRDCREIIAAISEAEECESTPEKLKYCAEIYDMWSDYHKKASYVTDHSVLQSAEVSMGTLKSLPPDSSAENINELLAQAKSETQQVYDNSRINLSNIL